MIIAIKSILLKTGNFLRQSLVFTAAFSLVLQPIFYNQALANPSNIIPDGTTQTTTELSPNNITVVNIASPTGSGTSMNNFDQFNVDQTGAIMNNSSVVTNTQIGGWIYANPHLADGRQANVIVGEVTGNMPSNLLGYTEIAGGKAEFVLLNPNGIACAGCGFINTNSLTLGTGWGIYNADGSLASINMGNGNFSVTGAGLDATLVDYFRVISKNIQLSAPIWAKDELAIYQGSSNFNTSTNTFSVNANPQAGQTIGIDVSALGAMYAGKATLIASDLGLGVNISSDVITSRDGIAITANGDIVYNNLTSATSTNITANNNGSITQNGSLKSSGGDTNLTAQNNISIAGTSLSSTGNTTITAGGNISNSNNLSLQTSNLTTTSTGSTTLQNLNATVAGQTNVTANNFSVSNSNIKSTGGFASNVTNATNLTNTTVSTNGNANLTTKDLTLTTSTLSANQVNITASNNVSTTNSGINSNTSVLLNATNAITNSNSKLKGITDVTINSASLINTSGTLINSNGTLSVASTTISNDGSQIYSIGNQSLITNSLTNQNLSLIYSGGTLGINNTGNTNLTSLLNLGSDIYSTGNLSLKANTLTNSSSSLIQTGGTLSILSQTLTNQTASKILAIGNTNITATTLNNTGNSLIQTNGVLIEAITGNITQDSSQTLATGSITINASSLTNQNSSLIQTGSTLNITLISNLNNTATSSIIATSNATLTAVNATNTSTSNIITGGNFTGSFSGTLTNSANILAFGSITANNLNNQNGYLEAGTSVLITNNNFALNNSGGTIQSDNGNTTINSNYQFNNTNGQTNSANDINLNIKANQNYTDTKSKINAGGNIYLNSAGYDITEGSGVKFKTSNLFQVTASNFTNNSDINVGYIDFALSNALINNSNLVSTNDSQYIIRKNIINTGTIASGATLLLQGANITNTNVEGSTGLIYSAGNMEVAGSSSITNNANSAIVSGGTLGIYADTLITNGSNAQMWSVGNLTLAGYGNTSVATFNNGSTSGAAYLKSQGNMQIYANQINNIGKDNASLTEGSAYTVATVGYGGYPGMDSSKIMSQEVATNILTSTNSQIVAGGSMLINSNVYNQTADVLAGTNLTINGNVTNNVTHFTTRSLSESWANTYEDCWSSAFGGLFCSTEHDWWSGSHTNTFSSLTPSRIAAGGNLTISGSKISNDGGSAVYQNNTPLGGSSGGTNSGYSGSYASSFTNSSSLGSSPTSGSGTTGTTPTITLVTTNPTNGSNPTIVSVQQQNPNASLASPSLDLSAISNPAIASINTNPPVLTITNASGQNINFTYYVESNPVFAQEHNFTTSEYLFTHLDYNPSRQIILAFDPYSERRTVEDTIARTGMVQYLGNGAIDGLYANGLKYLEGNTTQIGHELTGDQISNLTKDIIIPVEEEVNGQIMLVPKIYFSADTLAKAQDVNKAGGQIYAGGNVTLLSNGDLTNKGYIGSGGSTSLIVQGDFSNIGGEINTGSNLSITAKNTILSALTDQNNQVQNVSKFNVGANLLINTTENISAYGASIKTGLDTYLTAGNNITIAAATSSSSMSAQGGDMSMSKSKVVASVLESGGNINIKSGGDFSLLAGQDTYSSHFAHTDDGALGTSSSVTKDSSGLTNVASSIKGNNVSIDSGNDATIIASNITATNNLSLEAKGNTNILASKDMSSSFSQETSSAGFISNSIDVKNHYNETVASSNLTAGNSMLISSGSDVNILGSNITGKDGNIVAGYYQDDNGKITRNEGNVNVMSVTELAKNYEYSLNVRFDVGGFLVATASGAIAGGITGCLVGGPAGCIAGVGAGALSGAGVGINSKSGHENTDESLLITQKSSNLYFENLEITASKDVNVQSSNINVIQDLVINAASFNVNDTYNTDKKTSIHTDISPDYVALAIGGAVTGVATFYASGYASNQGFAFLQANGFVAGAGTGAVFVAHYGFGSIGSSITNATTNAILGNEYTNDSSDHNHNSVVTRNIIKSEINVESFLFNKT
ncbi:two-partner secretion domain-containing protein [Candidatus Deianiraea vastatrix]|uniref:Member of ShlA/HecA/FhaA exoprotein family n=1 Tax=Candidatus Deianiraea vastatrix TaxID=2163644 RepID=A0A5B8XCI7_9RICK|nr:hemagglutinin repeat-containing protein [Candidatus Deianiraea vastatrix]QED23052.1 Putative member of ShlA/HecA/FhaA exoprotein family [Candidatus Deianiraea vastatrix]